MTEYSVVSLQVMSSSFNRLPDLMLTADLFYSITNVSHEWVIDLEIFKVKFKVLDFHLNESVSTCSLNRNSLCDALPPIDS